MDCTIDRLAIFLVHTLDLADSDGLAILIGMSLSIQQRDNSILFVGDALYHYFNGFLPILISDFEILTKIIKHIAIWSFGLNDDNFDSIFPTISVKFKEFFVGVSSDDDKMIVFDLFNGLLVN